MIEISSRLRQIQLRQHNGFGAGWIRLYAVFLVSIVPLSANANGVVSHIHISDLARELLPSGDLGDLLCDPEMLEAYRSGSAFPDSGYAAGDPYGEMAHWEPFTEAYVQHIRENFGPPPYESEAARLNIAFLMGQASHSMADQWFDSLFMARVNQYDGTDDTLDLYAEEFLIIEHDPDNQIEGWIDSTTINQVFHEHLDYSPGTDVLENGMGLIAAAVYFLLLSAGSNYEEYWMQIPWAGTHYYLSAEEAPGSLPHIAQVVSLYWQVLWHRLHSTDDLSNSFLLSWPPDGYENFEVNRDLVETRIAIAFGHGIDGETLTSDNVRLLDEESSPVPSTPRFIYGSDNANVLLLRPVENLYYDHVYTVEVSRGLRSLDGRSLPEPVTFSFHTRCSPKYLADCPPLPEPWEPPDEPPERPERPRDEDAGVDAGVDAGGNEDADADNQGDGGDILLSAGGSCDCAIGWGSEGLSHGLLLMLLVISTLALFRNKL